VTYVTKDVRRNVNGKDTYAKNVCLGPKFYPNPTSIAGGKLVEEWERFDIMGFMRQLGVVPTPEREDSFHLLINVRMQARVPVQLRFFANQSSYLVTCAGQHVFGS